MLDISMTWMCAHLMVRGRERERKSTPQGRARIDADAHIHAPAGAHMVSRPPKIIQRKDASGRS